MSYILEEIIILKEELDKLFIYVPLTVLASWQVYERAAVEQWAIHELWFSSCDRSYPEEHKFEWLGPPDIIKPWIDSWGKPEPINA